MALTPILNLPVRWQVLGVDVESLAPTQGFGADAYDVANVNGVLLVENPKAQEVELVYPFPTEDAEAEVRVVSSGDRVSFKKPTGKATDFVELLKALGEIPADQEPLLKQIKEEIKDFLVARVEIPAGQQVLRVHARQMLRPTDGATGKAFEVVFFAPLAGFILAPTGASKMSVAIAFPPQWAATGMTIGSPVITPIPGQEAPETTVQGPTEVGQQRIYGALWEKDPKVTIPYTYE
jgi:hypothetical protein